ITASRSPPALSPASPTRAIGAPTATWAPLGTRVRSSTPSLSASTSTTAFSVSTVASVSAAEHGAFSSTCHSCSTASTAFAATSGIRSTHGMSVPRHLGELGGDFLALGDGGPLEHLADARRRLATGDPLHRLVEP